MQPWGLFTRLRWKLEPLNQNSVCVLFSAQSSTVITVNQGVRGGKVVQLKKTVDEAVQSCPMVRQVFVAMRTENPVSMTARDVALDEVRSSEVSKDFCL